MTFIPPKNPRPYPSSIREEQDVIRIRNKLQKALEIIATMLKHESDVEFLDEVFENELNMTLQDVINFVRENQDD